MEHMFLWLPIHLPRLLPSLPFFTTFQQTTPYDFYTAPISFDCHPLVAVVHTFYRRRREPSGVGAVVIDHVMGLNPYKLVALVHTELRQCRLVPPIPLLCTAATILGNISCSHRNRALTGINFKALVGGDEGRMGPVCLHSPALRGPVVCIPNWAVHAHGLVLGKWYSSVFQIGMHSYWGLIHHKPVNKNQYIEEDQPWEKNEMRYNTETCSVRHWLHAKGQRQKQIRLGICPYL